MAGSNRGKNPARRGRKKLTMVPDPRGSPEGCCRGCSLPTGWAWLKTGCQENVSLGNQAGQICARGSLQGCEGGA